MQIKTTVEIPEALFRKAKASSPAWMKAFGGLRGLHKETKRINRVLERH
jgi:hypothetical protein